MVEEYYDDYESAEEQIYSQAQAQQDAIEDYPKPEEKASIFNIFKRILGTTDTSKVGNLDLNELYAVRTAQQVSHFVETLGYDEVAKYFRKKGEIVLSTSLSSKSKKPAFIEALITQKRSLSSGRGEPLGGKKPWKGKKSPV